MNKPNNLETLSLDGRQLKLVRLHASYHLPEIGETGTAFAIDSQYKKFDKVSLMKIPTGVYAMVEKNGKKGEIFIPDANIVGMTFE